MELPSQPFQRLVAVAEGGLVSIAAFAGRLASRDAPIKPAELIADPACLFPALQLGLPDFAEAHAEMIRRAELDLRDAANALALERCEPDVQLLGLSVLHTQAPFAVARAADSFGADLVALAAHHPGQHWACRLDPEEIAYAPRRKLLYVPSQLLALDEPPLARALIAVDGSPSAYAALRIAVGCLPTEVELRVIYVVECTLRVEGLALAHLFEGDRAIALARAAAHAAPCGARVSLAALAMHDALDDVASAILREARGWGSDLLVIGLQGRRVRRQAQPGSVASHVLRNAACPVLVAAPAEHVTDKDQATQASRGASNDSEGPGRSHIGMRKCRSMRRASGTAHSGLGETG